MYTNLKLYNLKGLKECILSELGQINIICGRNNSGKSTLLEAISTKDSMLYGKALTSADVDHIYKETVRTTGWGGDNSEFNQIYKKLILDFSLETNVWYANQEVEYWSKLRKETRKNDRIGTLNLSENGIQKAFSEVFKDELSTILIPPKRELELTKQIRGSDEITPLGGGILNRLFRAKNQPEGSKEKELFGQISEAFNTISGGYSFDVFMQGADQATLSFAYRQNAWIPAKDCGLGLQDLLVFIWFSIEPTFNILLIEEPESHMHPDMQRRLLSFFRDQNNKQYFITTHSNIFVNNAYVDKVFFTQFNETVVVDDATSRASILNDIGYDVTDNLVSDLVILVEGPKDVPFIEEFLIKYDLADKYNIKLWPLGGDIMAQLDLSVFVQSYKLIALVDQDPASATIRKRFIENCEKLNIPVYQTERYAIENYFPLTSLRQIFEKQIDEKIVSIDPTKQLEDQIGINVKNNNRKIAQKMTIQDIEGTDIENFFDKVVELVKVE